MRIISWNVNGLRACAKKGFGRWLVEGLGDLRLRRSGVRVAGRRYALAVGLDGSRCVLGGPRRAHGVETGRCGAGDELVEDRLGALAVSNHGEAVVMVMVTASS